MKKYAAKVLLLMASSVLLSGINGCKSDNVPTKRDLRMVMEDHFDRDIYKGYVDVLDVDILEEAEAEYMGGQYFDVRIKARIRVNKGHVISKRYTATSFEVNEEWAERYDQELAEAQTEEQREEINSLFNANTFSEGEHAIEGILGFALLEGKWRLLTMMLGPKGPDDIS